MRLNASIRAFNLVKFTVFASKKTYAILVRVRSSLLSVRHSYFMYIKSLTLHNVKGFEHLAFDFERTKRQFSGWTVLVGGNASGKSTILKTIALAVSGPDAGLQLMSLDTSGWIRQGSREAVACVEIVRDETHDKFTGSSGRQPKTDFPAGVLWRQPEETGFGEARPMFIEQPEVAKNQNSGRAQRGPWEPNASGWFCAGYGPMRRLSGSSPTAASISSAGGSMSRFVTLFREDAALSDSEAWLKLNHSRYLELTRNLEPIDISERARAIGHIVEGARRLLNDGLLPHGLTVESITVDHVHVRGSHGVTLPMRDISDGCRSIYATVLDLVHGMAEVYGVDGLFEDTPDGGIRVKAPGVVLIDEIEAHLHPKWQRDIPEWFKTHFPNVQFIVTTHSPLVAQAADENGVFILPSLDDVERLPRRLDPHECERLRLGKAEKTLLGAAFGLKNTRSQWANERIREWQRLDAKRRALGHLNTQEEIRYQELHTQMEMAYGDEVV